MGLPFGQSVTVHRPGGTDRFGDRLAGTTHTVSGCAVAPAGSSESYGRGETVTTGVALYGPYGSDIKASDVIELADGSRFEVVGEPAHWKSPFTALEAGMQVFVERVTG